MTVTSRKTFSETVPVIGGTAVRVGALMRTSGYGFERDVNNAITSQPSMDSFNGSQLFLIPGTAVLYVGDNQFVRDVAGAGPPRVYKGTPVDMGASYNVVQPGHGIIDPDSVWVYSAVDQDVAISFVGF